MIKKIISKRLALSTDELSAREADKLTDYRSLSLEPLTADVKRLQAGMRAHSAKRMVSLRASTADIDAVKKRATKLGIPYQTYLALMIRQLAQGRLNVKI